MRVFIILVGLSACAHSVNDPLEEYQDIPTQQLSPPKEDDVNLRLLKKTDACVPDHFAANAIPTNYRLDPSCPPDIYDPPKFIPPWDPEPVIK